MSQANKLAPPSDEIAEEFNIKYNKDYYSENATIYMSYGKDKPPALLSECPTGISHVGHYF
jgi:hypothetical protein